LQQSKFRLFLVKGSFQACISLYLWNMSFAQARSLVGHKGGVLCVCFSLTGQYILSGSQDRTIQLWNAESGKAVARFVEGGHGQDVRDVQCSNDSAQIISGGQDKQFLVWDVARCSVSRKVMKCC
jgi:WD40 repeat protein